ncbi:prolyl oligopeptidase family serine peptidase [Peterkaempfera sp. SMS 1(5)a]|uniref:S9 family peptidase n=1 Tax=Peterkaempfera podocarpi TaxID=3232308 RepID=UPI00366CF33C
MITEAPATTLPYGQWPSPITAEQVAASSGGLTWPAPVGQETWWCASDPQTATVRLMRCGEDGTAPAPVLGPGWSVRNRSLGYGGRPYLVLQHSGDGHLLVFTDHRDQRVHRAQVPVLPGGASAEPVPAPLTPPDEPGVETCYAGFVPGPGDEVWCVRETTREATGPEDADPAGRTSREIVAIPLDGRAAADPTAIRVVARSHHFISGVRISPDGRRLAWIGWDHPRMPWEATDLMVARLADGVAVDPERVLGGGEVSVPQAEWAAPDTLLAMADPDGWANLHRIRLSDDGAHQVTNLLPMERECAGALWRVDPAWFAVTDAGVVLRHGVGDQQLALFDPATGALQPLAPDWTEFQGDLGADRQTVALVAGSAALGTAVLRVPLPTAPDAPTAPARRCTAPAADPTAPWRAVPQRRTAQAPDGHQVHYVYHPPTNPAVRGPQGETPPLLIHVHGGPTSATGATPDTEFSYFCSRGFAVASVDYGGSTGYGRAYRDRLRHTWGQVDVDDSVTVARALAAEGLADPARTAVRGGSAGGWTTLACLARTDEFCAGAVYYPISDALDWAGGSTHDFESRYLEYLIGRLPQDRERYEQVSPLAHADDISAPLVMLQGADDFICRPEQAQRIVDAVSARGLWHRYLVFDGEGHGFRKADSVARSILAEVELYEHVMGLVIDRGTPQ